ncbi:hypothetical protein Plhal304r1_c075g0162651 [Plasmopara halstedii]
MCACIVEPREFREHLHAMQLLTKCGHKNLISPYHVTQTILRRVPLYTCAWMKRFWI